MIDQDGYRCQRPVPQTNIRPLLSFLQQDKDLQMKQQALKKIKELGKLYVGVCSEHEKDVTVAAMTMTDEEFKEQAHIEAGRLFNLLTKENVKALIKASRGDLNVSDIKNLLKSVGDFILANVADQKKSQQVKSKMKQAWHTLAQIPQKLKQAILKMMD